MAEDGEKKSEDEDSIWRSIIEEVKKEGKPVKEKSIDVTKEEKIKEVIPKQGAKKPESIEKESIEKSIEIPEESIEKPVEKEEEPVDEAKPEEITKLVEKPSKFTTIMITKELKERLAKEKNPKESYGDLIERLLEK
jgi:hypothetical protein